MGTSPRDPADERVGLVRGVCESLRELTLDINRYARHVARSMHIPSTDVHATGILHAAPQGVSASELGQLLSLTPSATTSLIDRMERAGHAVRHVSETDARRARIVPTDLAVSVSRERFTDLNDAIQRVLDGSTPEEAEAFSVVLRRLADEMQVVVEEQRHQKYFDGRSISA